MMWSTPIALVAPIIAITSAAPLDGQRQPGHLAKRAEPQFLDWDDSDQSQVEKRDALRVALQDTYNLASTTQFFWQWYPDILDKYFPREDHKGVKQVFNNIVPSYLLTSTTPGPIVGDYQIVGRDFLAGLGDLDICAKPEAEGYTRNIERVEPPTRRWAFAHFCPAAFCDDVADDDPAPRLSDISCEDFNIQGQYSVAPDMDALGSIILHEMTHFNAIGQSMFGSNPPDPDVGGSLITDLNNGYGPVNTRRIRAETPQLAKRNADNYVYAALEIYWTVACNQQLAGQNGRFGDPIP